MLLAVLHTNATMGQCIQLQDVAGQKQVLMHPWLVGVFRSAKSMMCEHVHAGRTLVMHGCIYHLISCTDTCSILATMSITCATSQVMSLPPCTFSCRAYEACKAMREALRYSEPYACSSGMVSRCKCMLLVCNDWLPYLVTMLASCFTYSFICIGLGCLPFTMTCMRLLVYMLVSLASVW